MFMSSCASNAQPGSYGWTVCHPFGRLLNQNWLISTLGFLSSIKCMPFSFPLDAALSQCSALSERQQFHQRIAGSKVDASEQSSYCLRHRQQEDMSAVAQIHIHKGTSGMSQVQEIDPGATRKTTGQQDPAWQVAARASISTG